MSGILSSIATNYAIASAFPSTVKVLVVGGGGQGGYGSGGGAGGYQYDSAYAITNDTLYSVTVGAGGNVGVRNGGNSVFGTITAIGGGAGGFQNANGANGGSGGGGGLDGGNTTVGGTGTQGYDGGGNGGPGSGQYPGGGGGGAGAVGGTAIPSGAAGNGGIGLENSISGSPVYYAGGGGGATYYGGGTAGTGGTGGGGNGSSGGAGDNGTDGLGGGGGGSGSGLAGGNGGSGVVIISYVGDPIATGGTITSSGGNTIHTFTSSGSFVVGFPLSTLDGLISYHPMNGNGNDVIGAYPLTLNGASLVTGNLGLPNTAYSTIGLSDGLKYGTTSIFNGANIGNTIMFWFNAYSGFNTGSRQWLYILIGNAGEVVWILIENGVTNAIDYYVGNLYKRISHSFTQDSWHQIAVTWDGTTAKFYHDGILMDSGNSNNPNTMTGATANSYGSDTNNPRFQGYICQGMNFNRALSAGEINLIYETSSTIDISTLL